MEKKLRTTSISSLRQIKGEVWEVGRRAIDVSVRELEVAGERPELLLAIQLGGQNMFVLADGVTSSTPPGVLAKFVLRAMSKPQNGKPRRPEVIRVGSSTDADALSETLAAVGVELQVTPELATLDAAFEQLAAMLGAAMHLGGDYRTQAARAGQGLSEDGLREFFHTAKEFYQEELWLDYADEDLFEIELQFVEGPSKTLYGALMGNLGQEFGLALYPSLEDFQRFYEIGLEQLDEYGDFPAPFGEPSLDPEEQERQQALFGDVMSIPCIGLTYTTQNDVPPPLLEEAKQLKLPLADKTAFPLVMATGQGRMEIADGENLRDLLLAMKAILDWDDEVLEREPENDIGFTTTANFPAIAGFHGPVVTRTRLRLNPFLPEESKDFFAGNMDEFINEFYRQLTSGQPARKPTTKTKSKTPSSKKKKASGKKSPPNV